MGKECTCLVSNAGGAGDVGSIPGSGRSPGEGNGNPFQYSCLENPMDRGAWCATVHGVAKSRTPLSNYSCTQKLSKCSLTHGLSCSLSTWPLQAAQINQSLKEIVDLILKQNIQKRTQVWREIYLHLPFISLSTYYNALHQIGLIKYSLNDNKENLVRVSKIVLWWKCWKISHNDRNLRDDCIQIGTSCKWICHSLLQGWALARI